MEVVQISHEFPAAHMHSTPIINFPHQTSISEPTLPHSSITQSPEFTIQSIFGAVHSVSLAQVYNAMYPSQ